MITFYLGTHEPSWLRTAGVPLFVSHRRLARYKTYPRAAADWALDSGGFSELQLYGEWRTTPEEYVAAVRRYDEEIGRLAWAAPQDWMCEPLIIDGGRAGRVRFVGTHLSTAEHQRLTVINFVRLEELWGDRETSPFMPPLQGYRLDDYLRCWDLYDRYGVDLTKYPLVGLGSVCRRQATSEIDEIVTALRARDPGLPLHGFGVKIRGLASYGSQLASADSLAWSFDARYGEPLPGCTHRSCANCKRYALIWRERVLRTCGLTG